FFGCFVLGCFVFGGFLVVAFTVVGAVVVTGAGGLLVIGLRRRLCCLARISVCVRISRNHIHSIPWRPPAGAPLLMPCRVGYAITSRRAWLHSAPLRILNALFGEIRLNPGPYVASPGALQSLAGLKAGASSARPKVRANT